MPKVRKFCESGIVLHDGKLEIFDDVEDAILRHKELNS